MRAHIERDVLTGLTKIWLFREESGGTVFMWPTGYDSFGGATWYQEIVPSGQERADTIKPAIEMAGFMWDAFVKAIRDLDGDIPAGKLLWNTLVREQNRVDMLLTHLCNSAFPMHMELKEGP